MTTSKSRNKNAQIAAKNLIQKYKNILRKKVPLAFTINDAANAETVDYNTDTNMTNVSSNKSAQIAAKKLVNKYKNISRKRKRTLGNYTGLNKKSKDNVIFIKQVPLHPREWLKRLSNLGDDKVHFVKEVVSAKPKLITKTKKKIDKMKHITDQMEASLDNTLLLMAGEFSFSPKKILNKRLIFDKTVIAEETIIEKIIEGLNDPF